MSSVRIVFYVTILGFPLNSFSRSWAADTFTFVISDLLGNDGNWQTAFEEAGERWNDAATRFRIVTEDGTGNGYCTSSGNNSVRFSSMICGEAFGESTLAVASSWFVGDEITKVDITFNNSKSFSIYDGDRTGAANDFRRVAVHELGHAMGLPHSDDVDAVMFATSSNTFLPTLDDVNALRAVYGSTTHDLQLASDGPGLIRVRPLQDGTGVVVDNVFKTRSYGDSLDCVQPNCLLQIQDGLRLSVAAEPIVGSEFVRWEGTTVTGSSVTLAPLFGGRSLTAFFSSSGSTNADSDGDGVVDSEDRFPSDPDESQDTDGDGVGNNADTDDDGDGISDENELRFGLSPLDPSDAQADLDGDGVSNLDEVNRGTDPRQADAITRRGIVEFKYAWFETAESESFARVSVHRILGSEGGVSVSYSTRDSGSATAGPDYSATAGELSWADGELGIKTFDVAIQPDLVPEPEHDIGLRLFGATNGVDLGLHESVLVVRNDDLQGDGSPLNGILSTNRLGAVNERGGSFLFELGRFRGSDGQVSITLAVESDTAQAGSDFVSINETVVWADGELGWKSVEIPILDDGLAEGVESFLVRLSGTGGIYVREGFTSEVQIFDDEDASTQSYRFPRPFLYALESTSAFSASIIRAVPGVNEPLSLAAFSDTGGTEDFVQELLEVNWSGTELSNQISISIIDDNIDETRNGNSLETLIVAAATDSSFGNVVALALFGLLDREDTDINLDTDRDGATDIFDIDDDNDGARDWLDDLPLDGSEIADSDRDGIGNRADADDDNDGVPDVSDAFPTNSAEFLDTDGDGTGNNADDDDDGDGVADTSDAFPLDRSETTDSDGDGVGDNSDTNAAIRLDPSKTIQLSVAGASLISASGNVLTVPLTATAVSLNVTVVSPSSAGFITVYPCGVTRPLASNVNYVAGQVVPNGVVAPIGSNGKVCFYSSQSTDIIVDVAGWFAGESFTGATPQRLVDTRDGTGAPIAKLTSDSRLSIQITDLSVTTAAGASTTIPSSISAAGLNITVVNPAASGFITVYPCDVARPNASNVNFVSGQVIANGVVAPVSSSGKVCLYSSVPSDIIVDLAGWFGDSSFIGATPSRLVDTRDGTGGRTVALTSSDELNVPVRGLSLSASGIAQTVPAGATAAALNVTVVTPGTSGFVTVYPCGVSRPLASNLNYIAGDVVANNVIAPIGADGSVCLYTSATSDIIVDIAGWFSGDASNGFVGSTPKRFVDTRDGTGPAPQ